MSRNTNEAHSLFVELQQQYLHQLEDKIAHITTLWERWQDGTLQRDDLVALQRIAHNLAGSGATFGLQAVSDAARALDAALQTRLSTTQDLTALSDLAPLVTGLLDALRERKLQSQVSVQSTQVVSDAILIYVAGCNAEETAELTRQIAYFGYVTESFLGSADLLAAVERQLPNLIVLDVDLQDGGRVALLRQLSCMIGMGTQFRSSLLLLPPISICGWLLFGPADAGILPVLLMWAC